MRPSLASRLGALHRDYIRDLDARSAARQESPEIRRAKEDILVKLTEINPDPPATASSDERVIAQNEQLAQIEEKLALLDRIEFGETTDLTGASGAQRFKRSQLAGEGFLVGIIRGITSAFGKMIHFEDVINTARGMLQEQRDLLRAELATSPPILIINTPEAIATRPHLSPESLASERQETIASAMTDFARNTRLDGELYPNEGGADAAYTAAMEERIRTFTGEADIDRGYAGVIAHTPGQGFATPLVNEFLDHIPSLDSRSADKPAEFEAVYGRNQLGWSKAEDEKGGFFLKMEIQVRAVREPSTSKFYAASSDPRATKPIAVEDEKVAGITRGTSDVPPLFTIQVKARYTLPPGADRPIGHVERIEIANRYPASFPFREADQPYVINPALSTVASSAPAAGAGAGVSSTAPAAAGAGAALPHWIATAPPHTTGSGPTHGASPAPAPATGETADTDDAEGRGESGMHLGGHG